MLSISNVDVFYGDIQVLYNLSLKVEGGEIFALFGRNGAGKTTLLRSCVGLLPVRVGNITFNTRDITNMETYKICSLGVGFTFQERCVFPILSVVEHFALAATSAHNGNRRNLKEIRNEALDLFPDLEPHLNDRGATLSGGEGQMLKLAIAVVRRPKLLLLDEPSTGLSAQNIHRFANKLRELKGETTIFIAEQSIRVALQIADSFAIVRDGAIIHQDIVKSVDKGEEVVQKYILG